MAAPDSATQASQASESYYTSSSSTVGQAAGRACKRRNEPQTRQHTLSLDIMLQLLLPKKTATIAKKHDDTGADAEMTRLVYIVATKLAGPPQGVADRKT